MLHELPYLDHNAIEAFINSMPNLRTLAIRGCVMLDLTKLPDIVRVVKRHPRVCGKGPSTYIKVDFYPFRFSGPPSVESQGSCFLVTHHEPIFHVPKAATALLCASLPEAHEIGMDLLSDSSSFWSFFRQLPGPCPLWAVKVREAIITRRESRGRKDILEKAADNLCAALCGDLIAPEPVPVPIWHNGCRITSGSMPFGYWREERTCPQCGHTLLESLFVFMEGQTRACWGCRAVEFVSSVDHSHFRLEMRRVSETLMSGIRDRRRADLLSLRRSSNIQEALRLARRIDSAWQHYHDLDPEKPAVYFSDHDAGEYRRVAGSIMRWMRYLNPVPRRSDFRFGGPQYRSLSTLPSPPVIGRLQPKMSKSVFAKSWRLHHRHRNLVGRIVERFGRYGSQVRFALATSRIIQQRVKNIVMLVDYVRQNRRDWEVYDQWRRCVQLQWWSNAGNAKQAMLRA